MQVEDLADHLDSTSSQLKAPEGHLSMQRLISWASAASTFTQGRLWVLKTWGSPNKQLAECWHFSFSKHTLILLF